MGVEIRVKPDAEQDLDAAYSWYEERQPGLGEDLIACVHDCFEAISAYPLHAPVAHNGFRRAMTRRFPYAVFYIESSDAVTIYGIFHMARNPRKWRRQLKRRSR